MWCFPLVPPTQLPPFCNLYTWKFNFGWSIWDKSVILLGTIWGTRWELDGNWMGTKVWTHWQQKKTKKIKNPLAWVYTCHFLREGIEYKMTNKRKNQPTNPPPLAPSPTHFTTSDCTVANNAIRMPYVPYYSYWFATSSCTSSGSCQQSGTERDQVDPGWYYYTTFESTVSTLYTPSILVDPAPTHTSHLALCRCLLTSNAL
jgi:hypothetical protein